MSQENCRPICDTQFFSFCDVIFRLSYFFQLCLVGNLGEKEIAHKKKEAEDRTRN